MDVTGNAGVFYNPNLLWISGVLYNPNLLRIFKGFLLTNAGSTYVLLPRGRSAKLLQWQIYVLIRW